jgi:thioredoxin-dependent peroxiredoxin
MALQPGDPAPDFEGITTDGSRVTLKDYRGRKLVLYFYPMDDTPGCTKQACSLRDANADIAAKGAAILGVSAQKQESHQHFTEKHRLNFPLLVDAEQEVAKRYGATGSGLIGAALGLFGMNKRITFIIDEEGRIARIIDSPHTASHGEEVLSLL